MTLFVILLAACKKDAPVEAPAPEPEAMAEPAPVAPVAAPEPVAEAQALDLSAGEEQMLVALSARDGSPTCEALAALVEDPVASLTKIVANVQMPPSAPMRAARCLVQDHADVAGDTIEGWMRADDTEGLARLVMGEIEHLPPELATRFAKAGLEGPHQAIVRPEVEASEMAEVRALAQ
ncbi:MAG: hypothetical protein H6735_30740 [Alphaproteobacteria bacterium]|nr:hypothetical protein [Alphaproteobacteria bacterium]